MKKVCVSVLVLLLAGTMAMAAKAPVKTADPGTSMKYGVGVDIGGLPHLRIKLNKDQSVDIGLGFTSTGSGVTAATASSTINLLGRFENKLMALGDSTNSYWGGTLGFTSVSGGTTTISLLGLIGAETMINPNLSLYGNINVLGIQLLSAAGASQTNFMILNASALAYTGFRVYL